MLRYLPSVIILAVSVVVSGVSIAQARPDTWVAPDGGDSGTCPSTAPCRTFAYAYTQTSVNGSINVASSGHYGPLTISKAISIVADGVEAAIIGGTNGAAIKVQAPPTAIVSLRGLTIDMRGGDNHGIFFISGAALHVHDCVIRRSTNGILFSPASGTSQLHVSDSVVANNMDFGVYVRPTGSGSAKAVLDRVRVENSVTHGVQFEGFFTTGSVSATVSDSVSSGHGGIGFGAGGGSGTASLMIDRSTSANNGTGIFATAANATVRIGDSTVSGNTGLGLHPQGGGVIASYGTNKVNGNGTDGAPTSTITTR
jgi:hypothetical protein